jgi:hypothetical protein
MASYHGVKYSMERLFTNRRLWLISIALPMIAIGTDAKGQVDGSRQGNSVQASVQLPNDWKFEPPWRERGDCGPLSLYVLMRLADRQVTIADVKNVVPFDPDIGCSLADLAHGADALGFPMEIRFVNPRDVPKLPSPFILHTEGSLERRTGHFLLVADYSPEKRRYHVIDTTFEILDPLPEEWVLRGFTGYVLLPKNSLRAEGSTLSLTLVCLGCILAGVTLFLFPYRKKTQSGIIPSAMEPARPPSASHSSS